MNLKNIHNPYQQSLGRIFDETPKAVLAAIACSAYEQLGTPADEIPARIAAEWVALHFNGIVENKPTRHVIEIARAADPLAGLDPDACWPLNPES